MMTLRSKLLFTIFGLLLGMAASAVVMLLSAAPRGMPVVLQPAPTPAQIQVDISGAVQQPGVYSLPGGSRVQEAIQAAGGLSDGANRDALNLAAIVKDGQKLVIPAAGDSTDMADSAPSRSGSVPAEPDAGNSSAASVPGSAAEPELESNSVVNLNTAPAEALETLPGVGPTRAQDIIAYREAHGGFKTIEEIQEVKGIGPATFEKMKDRITVE